MTRIGATRFGVRFIGAVVSPLQRALLTATGGRVSLTGRAPVLLLTVAGRRTGRERTVPLFYLRDGSCLAVCNVNPGFEATNPWVLNLRAAGTARVRVGGVTRRVHARAATAAEADRLWPRFVGVWPAYARFAAAGGRRAIFLLCPAGVD